MLIMFMLFSIEHAGKSIKISIVENLLHTKRVIALEVKIIRYFTKMFNVDAPLKETNYCSEQLC